MKDLVTDWLHPEATKKALCSCPVSWPVGLLELLFTTVAQVKPEHPLSVQPQQEVKLSRHGVEFRLGLSVVVVVVSQSMESMWVIAEGPEPVEMHVGTELQRQTGHDYAGAEPHCSQALGAPEDGQTLEVLRVEEDRSCGAFKVLNGVDGPQGHGSIVAEGEGGNEQQGVAVGTQTFHKWTATSH